MRFCYLKSMNLLSYLLLKHTANLRFSGGGSTGHNCVINKGIYQRLVCGTREGCSCYNSRTRNNITTSDETIALDITYMVANVRQGVMESTESMTVF
ncbi:unnamed protein product [Linum tenue]|uniref:Secreted protein n=1 Tax=Linum tenue TaxID=586396 RepID=A0AAV0MLP7_9ROSI|nr:unnamed protein product [Linum tenue]